MRHHHGDHENFEDLRSRGPDGQQYPDEDMRSMIPPADNEEFKDDMPRGMKHDLLRDDLTDRSGLPYASFKAPKNAEESVVPAHGLKKPIDFNTVTDDDFNGGSG
jgi:hypothetical protein